MSEATRQYVEKFSDRIGLSALDTADGILKIANATMERAIKVISVERGFDTRDFILISFGGAGGLHAASLAENLGIRTCTCSAKRRVTAVCLRHAVC